MNDLLTLWTVRLACICYVAALLTRSRWFWTAGLAAYLAHVAAAFTFHHHWSHAAAYRETARQTAELFGVQSGYGIYFNYFFTGVWLVDVVWLWTRPDSHRARAPWISAAIHVFMAFMFFNATVVFASGWTRWFGVAATAWLAGSRIKMQARH